MRYLGSKTMLLDKIGKITEEYSKTGVFCDPFGGIGTVGAYMKRKGYQVITGDILYFAHCFQVACVENHKQSLFENIMNELNIDSVFELENYLNCLASTDGWIVEEYARKRQFFTIENAFHIQACYNCIHEWNKKKQISEKEYEILIASLIHEMDKVANTAGTYYAYLKKYYRKALQHFRFRIIQTSNSEKECKSYLMDANELVKNNECDILYLDPPYNERKYERYYHLPENIAKGIKPIPKGKSGVYISEERSSKYNMKKEALLAFEALIATTTAKCIIFHYTDNGLIPIKEAKRILNSKGHIDEYYFDSKGYNTVSNVEKCQHHIIRVIR